MKCKGWREIKRVWRIKREEGKNKRMVRRESEIKWGRKKGEVTCLMEITRENARKEKN